MKNILETRILENLKERERTGFDTETTAVRVSRDLVDTQTHKVKYRLDKLVKAGELSREITYRWDKVHMHSGYFGGVVSCKRKMAIYKIVK
jgi:hypothetical protein